MPGNVFSRDKVAPIVVGLLGVLLFLAVVAGTAALVMYGGPFGDQARTAAEAFAWAFAGLFVIMFVVAAKDERKAFRERGTAH